MHGSDGTEYQCHESWNGVGGEFLPALSVFNMSSTHRKLNLLVVKWRCPNQTLPPNSHTSFQKKALYLESIGIDSFSLIENHPTLITASLDDIKSTVEYITAMDFTAIEFRRMVGMCPEILTTKVSDIIPVFMFLHEEVRVSSSNIKHVINRRPRLIICNVDNQLRPTMYFLQSIGIKDTSEVTFQSRLETFVNSSTPLKTSPLWCAGRDIDQV
ncbi:transcription termination factor family protein [Trifolium pratense]|uniref:Transcription termination factor family protein n=1 Tax=Trifolium pratense TaxID=57577 RepID=A0A2K3NH12_TRIPR|nr:transcription termination factor family protein [Trifolium pratense]